MRFFSVSLCVCLCVSLCLSLSLSVCLFVCLSSVCLSVSLSLSFSSLSMLYTYTFFSYCFESLVFQYEGVKSNNVVVSSSSSSFYFCLFWKKLHSKLPIFIVQNGLLSKKGDYFIRKSGFVNLPFSDMS